MPQLEDETPMKRYRVWLRGSSMTASYDGKVDVVADDEDDAVFRAKQKLTGPRGTFFDWSPGIFRVERVERLYE